MGVVRAAAVGLLHFFFPRFPEIEFSQGQEPISWLPRVGISGEAAYLVRTGLGDVLAVRHIF
jgi:hypothetical protein